MIHEVGEDEKVVVVVAMAEGVGQRVRSSCLCRRRDGRSLGGSRSSRRSWCWFRQRKENTRSVVVVVVFAGKSLLLPQPPLSSSSSPPPFLLLFSSSSCLSVRQCDLIWREVVRVEGGGGGGVTQEEREGSSAGPALLSLSLSFSLSLSGGQPERGGGDNGDLLLRWLFRTRALTSARVL